MKKIIFITVASLSLIFTWNCESQASQLNFSVNPVIPDNQQDKESSYFDLKLEPDQEQDLTVTLKNSTNKSVLVDTSINRATTNLNGVVEYGKIDVKKDSSLLYNIEDLVKVTEPEIEIPPNGEKNLILKVKAPAVNFDGIIAGGLTFKEKNNESGEEEKNNGGLAIKNEYAYVVGFVLHGENENIQPNLELKKVKEGQVNVRNVINATFQNPNPMYLNNLTIDAKISKENSTDVLYSSKQSDMQMAPNSNFAFPIPLKGESLKSGTYILTVEASSSNDKWKFSKKFTITKENAKKLNTKDVSIEKDNSWMFIVLFGVLFVFILVLLYLVLHHRKKERLRRERIAKSRKRKQKMKKNREQLKTKN